MDFDRLSLPEVSLMSKVIDTLGMGDSTEEIQSRVNMLECMVTLYRKHLGQIVEWNKRGE